MMKKISDAYWPGSSNLRAIPFTRLQTIKEGLKLLSKEFINVVISDVKLPDGNGVDLTAKIKNDFPATEVIVLTAFGTIEDGVKAIKNGAF